MAEEDALLAALLYNVVLPVGCLLALLTFSIRNSHRYSDWAFANFYSRYISDAVSDKLALRKSQLFASLETLESRDIDLRNRGLIRILEIGSGSGSNFKYYPKNCKLVCYDPNPYFRTYLFENQIEYPEVRLSRLVVSGAERLVGTADESVDAVVGTLVLCSVVDVQAVLDEVYRVLAPGGTYYFLDHTQAAPGTVAHLLQRIVAPSWKLLNMGCDLTRDLATTIKSSGFSEVYVEEFNMTWWFWPFSYILGTWIVGVASK